MRALLTSRAVAPGSFGNMWIRSVSVPVLARRFSNVTVNAAGPRAAVT